MNVAPVLAVAIQVGAVATFEAKEQNGLVTSCGGVVTAVSKHAVWIATADHCTRGQHRVCVPGACAETDGSPVIRFSTSDTALVALTSSWSTPGTVAVSVPKGNQLVGVRTQTSYDVGASICTEKERDSYCGRPLTCKGKEMSCGLVTPSPDQCLVSGERGDNVCDGDSGSPVFKDGMPRYLLSGRSPELVQEGTGVYRVRIMMGSIPSIEYGKADKCLEAKRKFEIQQCLARLFFEVGELAPKRSASTRLGSVRRAFVDWGGVTYSGSAAVDPDCGPRGGVVAAYLPSPADSNVLLYDHLLGTWSRFAFQDGNCASRLLKVSASGAALYNTVDIGRRIFVVNTNALAYETTDLKAEDVDSPDIAGLQQAASAIAGGLGSLLAVGPRQPVVDVAVFGVVPEALRVPNEVTTFLLAEKGILRRRLADLIKALAKLDHIGAELLNDRLSIRAAIQQFETGGDLALELPREPHVPRIAAVSAALRDTVFDPGGCPLRWTALAEAVDLALQAPIGPEEIDEAQLKFDGSLRRALAPGVGACNDVIREAALEMTALDLGKPWAPTDLPDWKVARGAIRLYLTIVGDLGPLMKDAKELLSKTDEALAVGAGIDAVAARVSRCDDVRGPLRACLSVLSVEEPWSDPDWYTSRKVTFKISPWSPLGALAVPMRASPVEVRLELTKRRFGIEASLGTVAGLGDAVRDRTWDAVSHPTRDQLVIGEVAARTRSGTPSVTLTVQPLSWREMALSPGFDLGAGLDPDRPFLSAGASIKIGSLLRIGIAYGFHRTAQLAGGQVGARILLDGQEDSGAQRRKIDGPFTVVKAKTDIQLKDGVARGWQFMLSVPLGKLNPFQKDDAPTEPLR